MFLNFERKRDLLCYYDVALNFSASNWKSNLDARTISVFLSCLFEVLKLRCFISFCPVLIASLLHAMTLELKACTKSVVDPLTSNDLIETCYMCYKDIIDKIAIQFNVCLVL